MSHQAKRELVDELVLSRPIPPQINKPQGNSGYQAILMALID